jgi:hypothetical protein
MRNLVLVVAVLLLAAPALAADVNIVPTADGNGVVTISYTASSSKMRGAGLDITLDNGATITAIGNYDPNYWVYPGSIDINTTTEQVDDYGTPIAAGGVNEPNVTLEMGSLYAEGDDANAPGASGVLLTLTVSGDCNVCIAENAARAGVVVEDTEVTATTNLPQCVAVTVGPEDINDGTCWDEVDECGYQNKGDGNCDGNINLDDLILLKKSFNKNWWDNTHGGGVGEYNCCADFTNEGYVNLDDLIALKQGFALPVKTGLTPATSNTSCPTYEPAGL